WLPRHLRLENEDGNLIGAVANYLKGHSQGEYVFDHGWADAFERAGGQYYPKFQPAVPSTPTTGPRLLYHQDYDAEAVQMALAAGLRQLTDQTGISSAHVTFPLESEIDTLKKAGFLHRTDQQFHFINKGFLQYSDFLNELSSRKRKALKKKGKQRFQKGLKLIGSLAAISLKPSGISFLNSIWTREVANGELPISTESFSP